MPSSFDRKKRVFLYHRRFVHVNLSILYVRTQKKTSFEVFSGNCYGAYMDNPESMAVILNALLLRQELTAGQIRQVFGQMMAGQCGEAEAAAFLTALRMKGETPSEVA